MVGPILFLVCIDDLGLAVRRKTEEICDDTKMGKSVVSLEDKEKMQKAFRNKTE